MEIHEYPNYCFIYPDINNSEEIKIINYLADTYGSEFNVYKKNFKTKKGKFEKSFIPNLIKFSIKEDNYYYKLLSGLFSEFITLLKNYNISKENNNLLLKSHYTVDLENIRGISVNEDYRDYQYNYCIDLLCQTRGVIVSPVGSGKTLIMAMLASILRELKTIILVPSLSLITQIKDELTKLINNYKIITVSDFLDDYPNNKNTNALIGLPIHFRSFNNVAPVELNTFPVLFADECFPAGTLIDNKLIESLRVDDYVSSFNHTTEKIEKQKIINIFKNKTDNLIKINFDDNTYIVCTKNHPFFTGKEYTPAINLKKTDLIYEKYSESIGKNENKQSDVQFTDKKKSERYFKKNETQTFYSRRKWPWFNYSPKNIIRKIGNILDSRISIKNIYAEIFRISSLLQNRFGAYRKKDCYRNRWYKSLFFSKERTRSKERKIFNTKRVESIEILESTSDERFREYCIDGYVYNIEVEKNNNYFANNILVHNCHQYPADIAKSVILAQEAPLRFGFTATPKGRSDGRDNDIVGLFGPIVELVSYTDLVKQKYVPKIDIQVHYCGWQEDYVYIENTLIVNNYKRNEYIVKLVKEHLLITNDPLVLILVRRLEHIEILKKYFNQEDIIIVTGEVDERDQIIADIKNKKYKIILASSVFTQGINIPEITLGINAAGGKAAIATQQKGGRMARGNIDVVKTWIDIYDGYTALTEKHSFERIKVYKENYQLPNFVGFSDKKLNKIQNDLTD